VRGHRSRSCGAGAWELAPTPVTMAADVAIATGLLVTARWSRTPSSPCWALVMLDFATACLLSMRLKTGWHRSCSAPSHKQQHLLTTRRKAAAEGLRALEALPPQTLPVLLLFGYYKEKKEKAT
jgi:hypothetical protein